MKNDARPLFFGSRGLALKGHGHGTDKAFIVRFFIEARQMTPQKEDLGNYKIPLKKRVNTCTLPFSGPCDTTSCLPAASGWGRQDERARGYC